MKPFAFFRNLKMRSKLLLLLFVVFCGWYCYFNYYPLPKINSTQLGPNAAVQMEIIKVVLASGDKYTCRVEGGLFKDLHLVHVFGNTYYSCYGIPFTHTIYRNHDTDFDEQFILTTIQNRVVGIDVNLNKIEQLSRQKPELFKTVPVEEYQNLHFLSRFKTLDEIKITPLPSVSDWNSIADASPRYLTLQINSCGWDSRLPEYDFSLLKNCTSLNIDGAIITRQQYLEILNNPRLDNLKLNVRFVEPKDKTNEEQGKGCDKFGVAKIDKISN